MADFVCVVGSKQFPAWAEILSECVMVNKYLKCKAFVGERLEVVRFWQNKVTRGVALVVLSAALLGCSNTESLEPQAKMETQAEVFKPTAAKEFTTKGKPTKAIETPWGLREIYDPAQDEEVLKIFSTWYEMNSKTYTEIRDKKLDGYHYFAEAEKTNLINFMRLGCDIRERTFDWLPVWYDDKKLGSECEEEFSGTKSSLSLCEKDNLKNNGLALDTQRVETQLNISRYHSSLPNQSSELPLPHHHNLVLGQSSEFKEDELRQMIFDINCRKWRGQNLTQDGWKFYIFD